MIRKIDGVIRKISIQKYIFREIIDYKKIVNDLPHSNPLIKEMVIQMLQSDIIPQFIPAITLLISPYIQGNTSKKRKKQLYHSFNY